MSYLEKRTIVRQLYKQTNELDFLFIKQSVT